MPAGRRSRLAGRLAGLSARRRALAAVASLLVLALAGAVAAAVATRGGGTTAPGGRPAAGRPPQGKPGPVVLVPGYGGSTSALNVLARRIRAQGRPATVLRLPGSGTGSLVPDAALLNTAVTRYLRAGAPSVDVVGYSAGGVVALIWARRDGGAARARRVITLGAPFHGTGLATDAQALLPGACPAACRQLVPGSPLLASLDVSSPAGLPRWLSLWTTGDQVVTPPDSAVIPGAIDVSVQSVCPSEQVSHSQLPTDPAVQAMVLQALGKKPLTRPAASACGHPRPGG